MNLNRSLAMFAIGFATLAAGNLHAQETAKRTNQSGDEQGVRDAIAGFARAFETGNAAAAAQLLTTGADLVADDDSVVRGREAIQSALTGHFAENPRVKIESVSNTVRFPSRDTAVVEGLVHVIHPDSGTANNRFEIHCVREDGKWLLSLIHEWPHEQAALLDLEWLIGSWKAAGEKAEVETTYEWFGTRSTKRRSAPPGWSVTPRSRFTKPAWRI